MVYLFVVLGHSNILGTNLNADNGEFLIISAESVHSEIVLWMPRNLQYQSLYGKVFCKMLMFICVKTFSWIYAQNFQKGTHKYNNYFRGA